MFCIEAHFFYFKKQDLEKDLYANIFYQNKCFGGNGLIFYAYDKLHSLSPCFFRNKANKFSIFYRSLPSIPRLDVMNLQEQLDLKLQQRQARETGICQVDRHLPGRQTSAG